MHRVDKVCRFTFIINKTNDARSQTPKLTAIPPPPNPKLNETPPKLTTHPPYPPPTADGKPMTPAGEEATPEDESIPLRIGDFVLLKNILNRDGLLTASGILDDDIKYSLDPKMFDEGGEIDFSRVKP